MANVFTQQQVEDLLRPYGFTGPAVNGAAAQFLQNNPTANTAFTAAAQQYSAAQPSAGVVPLTVEPLNSTQKTGLLGLSTPVSQQPGNDAMQSVLQRLQAMQGNPTTSPIATSSLQDAQKYTAAGAAPISQSEVQGLSNPFASGLNDQITQAGKVARAAILANQGMRGADSFGSTAQGNEMGLLDQGITNATNTNNYNTFQSALDAVQKMRGNNLTAGNVANNTASTAQGVTSNGNALTLENLQALFNTGGALNNNLATTSANQITAGNQIQGQNQNVANQVGANIQGGINYPISNIQNILSLLNSFQSGTGGAVAPANSLTQAGGAAGGIGDLLQQLQQSGVASGQVSGAANSLGNGINTFSNNAGNVAGNFANNQISF